MPEIFVAVGNYRGMFRHLANGGLGVPGVRVAAPDASFRDSPGMIPSDVRDKLVTALGSAAGLVNPVMGLLVAIGDLSVTLVKKWRETPVQDLQPHAVLLETLQAATSAGPTVLLFEDITGAGRELIWQILLYHVTRMPDRRLLTVVGADGPPSPEPRNGRDPLEGFAPVLRQVQEAVAKKRASWWWLKPLDLDRVREWIGPVDMAIGRRLIAVSGGDDEIAARNWAQWVSKGYVRKDHTGRWMPTGNDDPFEGNILEVLATCVLGTDAVPASVDALGLARQMLEYAALSGTNFSLTAVARVLSADRHGVTAEEIEELADLLTPTPGRPWLIETCGHAEIPLDGKAAWHWLYRFPSTDLATFLKASWSIANEPDQRNSTALKLLEAVQSAHGDHPLFFECCYRLARAAGDSQEAGKYSARIAASARRRQLLVRAQILLSLPDDDELALDELVRTTDELVRDGQLGLSIRVGERGHAMASRIGSTSQRAGASRSYGRSLDWSAQQAQAVPLLEECVRLSHTLVKATPGNSDRQRDYAIALNDLGVVYRELGRAQEAIHLLEEAVSLFRRLFQTTPSDVYLRRNLAARLQGLGIAYLRGGRNQDSIKSLKDAIRLFSDVLDSEPENSEYKRDLGVALGDLAETYLSADQAPDAVGASEEAIRLLRGSLDTDPENPDYRRQLARYLGTQSTAYERVKRPSEGVASLEQAVALYQAVIDSDPMVVSHQTQLAFTLRRLRIAYRDLGIAYGDAGKMSEQIGVMHKEISLCRGLLDSDSANATTYQLELGILLNNIGSVFWRTGQLQESSRSFGEAIALLEGLVQSDPENDDYRQALATFIRNSEEVSQNAGQE